MKTTKEQRSLTILFSLGAMLILAVSALVQNTVYRNAQVDSLEPYPDLYVANSGYYQAPEIPTVYFTFDDGPSRNTEAILDVLLEEEVKATFFVCAQYEDREYAAGLLKRMVEEGHTIGLHSYTHDYDKIYTSVEGYLADLNDINQFVMESAGVRTNLLRFPGGSRTSNCDRELMEQIVQEVTRRGYIFHDWTVVSGDDGASPRPQEELAGQILEGLQNRKVEVILCHDNPTPTTTPEAVRQSIRVMKEQGYVFDRLTDKTPPVQLIKQG